MNRLTNAAKYAAIIMSLIVTVTMVSGCKKNNTDVSSELNKSDIEETSQDMTGSGIEDSDVGSQSAEETAETESTEQTESDFEENTEQIETDAGQEETQNPYIRQKEPYTGVPIYENLEHIYMNTTWEYADHSAISDGYAVLYKASGQRKNIVVGVNAGHGTAGGSAVRTLCHPDGSLKSTGGSTAAGAATATAVSGGMTFYDGTPESEVTLKMAEILRDKLLLEGYDVLMIRDSSDVQLDNVARTVICNNVADCHISLHWDGDGLSHLHDDAGRLRAASLRTAFCVCLLPVPGRGGHHQFRIASRTRGCFPCRRTQDAPHDGFSGELRRDACGRVALHPFFRTSG